MSSINIGNVYHRHRKCHSQTQEMYSFLCPTYHFITKMNLQKVRLMPYFMLLLLYQTCHFIPRINLPFYTQDKSTPIERYVQYCVYSFLCQTYHFILKMNLHKFGLYHILCYYWPAHPDDPQGIEWPQFSKSLSVCLIVCLSVGKFSNFLQYSKVQYIFIIFSAPHNTTK